MLVLIITLNMDQLLEHTIKHPNFRLIVDDVINIGTTEAISEIRSSNIICAGAAMIGGISYFHKFAYDLLATNERILASTFDLAIDMFRNHQLERVVILSSSMVYGESDTVPTAESELSRCVTPKSTYGFQKLASEYFCQGAYEQYGLPYTVIRPFNCVGVGDEASINEEERRSGNIKLVLGHVLPDIVNKILKGQDPLHILGDGSQIRCYTHGKDVARGIRMAAESVRGINEDFNISTPIATTVLELAEIVWGMINLDKKFSVVSEKPYKHDIQKRIPDVSKAEKLLNFKTEISLDQSVREVVDYFQ